MGCYSGPEGWCGADLLYNLPVNAVGSNGRVYIGLRSRNVREPNAGAARVIQPEVRPERVFPKFSCPTGNEPPDLRNYFHLLTGRTPNYFDIPAGQVPQTLAVEVAIAGASATPVNFLLSRLGTSSKPTDTDPGTG
ncbi:MAG TPA: hypothetical protein VEX38_03230 [Fimbriimonadaceae bacterium]|nr:hypothetical protein [Fimbriimonadaceae bacterium]